MLAMERWCHWMTMRFKNRLSYSARFFLLLFFFSRREAFAR